MIRKTTKISLWRVYKLKVRQIFYKQFYATLTRLCSKLLKNISDRFGNMFLKSTQSNIVLGITSSHFEWTFFMMGLTTFIFLLMIIVDSVSMSNALSSNHFPWSSVKIASFFSWACYIRMIMRCGRFIHMFSKSRKFLNIKNFYEPRNFDQSPKPMLLKRKSAVIW